MWKDKERTQAVSIVLLSFQSENRRNHEARGLAYVTHAAVRKMENQDEGNKKKRCIMKIPFST